MEINVKIQLPEGIQNAPHCPTLGDLMKRIGNAARNAVIANTLGDEPKVCVSEGEPAAVRVDSGASCLHVARDTVARSIAQLTATAHNLDKLIANGR